MLFGSSLIEVLRKKKCLNDFDNIQKRKGDYRMRKFLICLAVIMALTMIGGRAMAVPFGDGGVALQGVLDNITVAPNPGVSSTNVLTDALSDSTDSLWAIHGSGGSVNTLIIELAQWANSNTFGIYDPTNSATRVQIFGGGAAAGSQALLSIWGDGSILINFVDTGVDFAGNVFGYYLDSTLAPQPWTGGVWYSNTALNADGMDHMAAYQGKDIDTVQIPPFAPGIWDDDEYILAFEDLHAQHWGNGNGVNDGFPEWSDTEPDFTDFVVMVESVDPIPEPATLLLLGLGLVGVAGLNRKKFMS
jgi:hypothetical protein